MSGTIAIGRVDRAHERGRLVRSGRVGAGHRISLLCPDPRREVVVTFAGWLTIVLFAVILTALAFPLGQYMAKVYTGKRVFLTPVFAWPERLLYRVLRVDPRTGAGLEGVREKPLDLLARRLASPLRDPAHAGRVLRPPRAEPARLPLRPVERDVQHGVVVHDEHELAVLQRRDDDDLPQPDDRADRAELAVRWDRDRRRGCAGPWDRRTVREEPRKFLAGPRAHDPVRARTSFRVCGDRARLPGGDRELLRLPDGAHDHGADADDRDGAGRLAGGDQGARDERGRVLQHELGAPVREPDRSSRTSSRCCSC